MKEIIVAVTGASGAVYAQRLLHLLEQSPEVRRVHLILTAYGLIVLREELDLEISGIKAADVEALLGRPSAKIQLHPAKDVGASIASGSYRTDGMVIIPCSMGSLGYIASGIARDLVHRAADVTLKEHRKLILVPRESPYNAIHLENMLKLQRAGAMIVPASPGFYHRPTSIVELVDHFVYRILDHLDISHTADTIWQGRRT